MMRDFDGDFSTAREYRDRYVTRAMNRLGGEIGKTIMAALRRR